MTIHDCGLAAGKNSINKAVVYRRNKNRTKTGVDCEISLCGRALDVLKRQFSLREELRRVGKIDQDLVFFDEDGAPMTDQDLYGRDEVWAYPADAGDCEDFVLLKRKKLYGGKLTGVYNPRTERAVAAFQTARGLRPTGKLARNTWTVMLSQGYTPVTKIGSGGQQVRRIQRSLNAAIHAELPVTGIFDQATTRAVRTYQRSVQK